ncbi:MAG: ATP-binding cassette domain-containing protein [Azospirillaceae bacterium]|nr:ATP-binding cassette domain-containing protein [Azospirillaceae bacterium]
MISVAGARVLFNKGTALETVALQHVDLTVDSGQFITVIGSNGAGKSTLLNALAGEVRLDAGTILIADVDPTRATPRGRAGLVARVFQDPRVGTCEDLTIEENLALAARRGRRRGLERALSRHARALFRERLAALGLGLDSRLHDRMGLLSGGQRQAIGLLMATLAPMRLLLLDEHTAALDPKTGAFVLDLTRRLVAEQKLTAIMVTHSMRDALACGDRTVMLDGGRVVYDVSGAARSRLDVPDLLRLFGEARGGQVVDEDRLLLG